MKFSDAGGGFAYAPNTAFVRESADDDTLADLAGVDETIGFDHDAPPVPGFRRLGGKFDAIRVVAHLRAKGVDAQPDHVLFAHGMTCCCGPHPAAGFEPWLIANPLHANPLHANPLHANPLHANPLQANPLHANSANGPTTSSVRPADEPGWFAAMASASAALNASGTPGVVVLDTGLAAGQDLPAFLGPPTVAAAPPNSVDVPDWNNDNWLDPVAGHGTFIAGIIERIAPGCGVEVLRVLQPEGDGKESDIFTAINAIADRPSPPAFLNLSFGGYVWVKAPMLSAAVLRAQQRGIVVVASAGNDGTCRPSYPAAIPGVVSVGAIGPDGPAWFSNYGDWVRSCAPGVDVVSSFFALFDGNEVPSGGRDIDRFRSWATWSGTSFAAPAVIGALVREMRLSNSSPTQAVARLIDAPGLGRIPGLGTVVNV
ncbi:MAG TPA: S8 family serine peptidase [Ilumatobacteraceae bacterium]|nr:S8 family serine peptidase [Ilumatobacteraceae bacterium]